MLGELCIGHMFIAGGDREMAPRLRSGLLGADYELKNGHYCITRVFDGESWNPHLYSPLGNVGVRAKKGEYILAINGKELTQATDIYLALEGKAGKRVMIKLGPNPDGTGAREVAVTPIESEAGLRKAAWQEENRRYVEQSTGGRCGYIHVPDTNLGGWTAFMRYYYSQNDKDAIIIDERFNHGGAINDFMVREMEKPLDFFGATRYGQLYKTPNAAVYGPKVMLVNEMAGSGGDIFPYLFKQHHTGKLIGHKTWGGELSAYGFTVIDGGSIRAPDDANFDIKTGEYVIDNVGVTPDITVELDPKLWVQGIDSQLQVAVAEIKKEMAAHPPIKMTRPKYPDKSKLK
jgi:tricorn protease